MNSSAAGRSAEETPATGRYVFDPARTTVRFATRHLFGLGRVSGTLKLREAELIVTEPVAATTLRAVLDSASFESGSPKRDADVLSAKYLDAGTYPDISFSSQGLKQQNGKWVAAGTVTAHGVAAPVDLTVDELDANSAGDLTLRASARVDRYAQGVTATKGMAARWLRVEINAIASRLNGQAH